LPSGSSSSTATRRQVAPPSREAASASGLRAVALSLSASSSVPSGSAARSTCRRAARGARARVRARAPGAPAGQCPARAAPNPCGAWAHSRRTAGQSQPAGSFAARNHVAQPCLNAVTSVSALLLHRGRPGATALPLPSLAHRLSGPPPPPHLAVGVWQPHRRRGRPLPPCAVGGRARVQHAHRRPDYLRMSGRVGVGIPYPYPVTPSRCATDCNAARQHSPAVRERPCAERGRARCAADHGLMPVGNTRMARQHKPSVWRVW